MNIREAFPNELITRTLPPWHPCQKGHKRQLYEVTEEFVYNSLRYGRRIVPKGFFTDFASTPFLARLFFETDSPSFNYATLLHDWEYTLHCLSKSQADEMLVESIALCGGSVAQQLITHWAVHKFGQKRWDNRAPNLSQSLTLKT